MSITATELKINLGKYLMLAETEDIYITRNGKVVAKLSNPYQDRVDVAKSLFGVLSNDVTLEEAHVVLSERPEDQLKAVEWAHEQKQKILDNKNRRIADALMEKMTPLIMKNSTQK